MQLMQHGCNCVLVLLKAVLSEGGGCLGRPGSASEAHVAPFILAEVRQRPSQVQFCYRGLR